MHVGRNRIAVLINIKMTAPSTFSHFYSKWDMFYCYKVSLWKLLYRNLNFIRAYIENEDTTPYIIHLLNLFCICVQQKAYTNIYFAVNIFTKLKPFAKKFNPWDSFYILKSVEIKQTQTHTYTPVNVWKTRNKISSKQNKMKKKLNWTLEQRSKKKRRKKQKLTSYRNCEEMKQPIDLFKRKFSA